MHLSSDLATKQIWLSTLEKRRKGIELVNMLTKLLSQLIGFYTFIVLVNVILSWVVHSTQNMVIRRIYWTTGQFVEPALAPIRQLLSPLTRNLGGIDISPIILIIFLQFLQDALRRYL